MPWGTAGALAVRLRHVDELIIEPAFRLTGYVILLRIDRRIVKVAALWSEVDYMNDRVQSRRGLFQATGALIASGVAFTFIRPADAWQVEQVDPASPTGVAYSGRCGGDSRHDALQTKLRAALSADPALRSLSANCPICGCPILVSR
jgi:hypothetical protein